MSKKNLELIFYPNPMYEYPVIVTEELISILDINNWEHGIKESAQNDGSMMMLYCDIVNSNDDKTCRLAFFSDGAILIQSYKNNKLSNDNKWYYNDSIGDQLFYNLANWIDQQIATQQ